MKRKIVFTGVTAAAAVIVLLFYLFKRNCPEVIQPLVSGWKGKDLDTETAVDVAEQRKVFESQLVSRQSANLNPKTMLDLVYAVIPEIYCPTMVRLGDIADGGKWICNPWRLDSGCIIYSLGVGGNPSFEKEIAEVTKNKCQIYSFDPNNAYASLFANNSNLHFQPWKLGQTTDWSSLEVRLQDAMERLKHTRIDILKIDIESGEFVVLPAILNSPKPLFCQLLIEMHESNAQQWVNLLRAIATADYFMFSKEANPLCLKGIFCFEYSFIHKQCFEQYRIERTFHHQNFARKIVA